MMLCCDVKMIHKIISVIDEGPKESSVITVVGHEAGPRGYPIKSADARVCQTPGICRLIDEGSKNTKRKRIPRERGKQHKKEKGKQKRKRKRKTEGKTKKVKKLAN